jgi:hypothetical protein
MTQHDTNVRLRHMLDYAHEATQMVQDKTRTDLDMIDYYPWRWCG